MVFEIKEEVSTNIIAFLVWTIFMCYSSLNGYTLLLVSKNIPSWQTVKLWVGALAVLELLSLDRSIRIMVGTATIGENAWGYLILVAAGYGANKYLRDQYSVSEYIESYGKEFEEGKYKNIEAFLRDLESFGGFMRVRNLEVRGISYDDGDRVRAKVHLKAVKTERSMFSFNRYDKTIEPALGHIFTIDGKVYSQKVLIPEGKNHNLVAKKGFEAMVTFIRPHK